MTANEKTLTPAQKELVAVGASVGAGCHPCADHHLEAGAKAGLRGDQLLAAVIGALGVAADAAARLGEHVRGRIGANVESTPLSRLDEALAALGGALCANDAAGIESWLRDALASGATRAQLEQAIATATTVQENAARIHVRAAGRLLDELAASVAALEAPADGGCGCGARADEMQRPVADAAPDAGAPSRGWAASGCGEMPAELLELFGAMAGCGVAPAAGAPGGCPTKAHGGEPAGTAPCGPAVATEAAAAG